VCLLWSHSDDLIYQFSHFALLVLCVILVQFVVPGVQGRVNCASDSYWGHTHTVRIHSLD